MVYLLDSNIFLRTLVKEDQKDFLECFELLEKVKKAEIKAITAGVILAEVGWVLKSYYMLSRKVVAKKLAGIFKLSGLKIVDGYDWIEAIEMYEKFNVKFLDAVLATMPESAAKKWTIVSYDEDFKKLPVKWLTPRLVIKEETLN